MASLTVQAHTHARNAVLETRKSNPVAASEEHDLAAGEFSAVGGSSTDREVCVVAFVCCGRGWSGADGLSMSTGFENASVAGRSP